MTAEHKGRRYFTIVAAADLVGVAPSTLRRKVNVIAFGTSVRVPVGELLRFKQEWLAERARRDAIRHMKGEF